MKVISGFSIVLACGLSIYHFATGNVDAGIGWLAATWLWAVIIGNGVYGRMK